MKFDEAKELLVLISSIDRRPFPENAAAIWFEMLHTVDFVDAKQAIHEHYTSLGARDSRGDVRAVLPADVKHRANAIREARLRASQRHALPAPTVRRGSTGRPAEVEAELERARLKAKLASEKYASAAA